MVKADEGVGTPVIGVGVPHVSQFQPCGRIGSQECLQVHIWGNGGGICGVIDRT